MVKKSFKNATNDLCEIFSENKTDGKFNLIDYDSYLCIHKYDQQESRNMKINGVHKNCSTYKHYLQIGYCIHLAITSGINTIVYIGSSGSDIVVTVKMYKDINIYLYKDKFNSDIRFDKRLYSHNDVIANVFINDKIITNNDIKKIKKKHNKIMVICNVKHRDKCRPGQESMNKILQYQNDIVNKFNASLSLVKFSLPYKSDTTLYMKGLIVPPIYSKNNGTETFLLIENVNDYILYDHDKYNNILHDYNKNRYDKYLLNKENIDKDGAKYILYNYINSNLCVLSCNRFKRLIKNNILK